MIVFSAVFTLSESAGSTFVPSAAAWLSRTCLRAFLCAAVRFFSALVRSASLSTAPSAGSPDMLSKICSTAALTVSETCSMVIVPSSASSSMVFRTSCVASWATLSVISPIRLDET